MTTIRAYSGWRGVTDPSGSLICASYEPIEGALAIRFKGETIYVFEGVPEAVYQSLIRTPFAGSFFRKKIKDKYPAMDPNGNLIPAKMDDKPVKAKLKSMAEKRLKEVKSPEPLPDQRGLF